jgi:ubiquitin-like 1-activating enzyme E1 A
LVEHVYIPEKTSSKNSERIAYTEQYASLESSLSKDWSSMSLKTLKKRTSPLAFVIYILLMFQRDYGTFPCEENEDFIGEKINEYLESMGISDSTLFNAALFKEVCALFHTEISPVAAILGGILAQDILRTLSANELPIKNWLYYNGLDETGSLHHL